MSFSLEMGILASEITIFPDLAFIGGYLEVEKWLYNALFRRVTEGPRTAANVELRIIDLVRLRDAKT